MPAPAWYVTGYSAGLNQVLSAAESSDRRRPNCAVTGHAVTLFEARERTLQHMALAGDASAANVTNSRHGCRHCLRRS